jgi:splicing factor U2AF subunit
VSIDGTDWKGHKVRVRRPKKFIEDYNKELDKRMGLVAAGPNNMPTIPGLDETEHKIYMGGVPTTMSSEEVRKLVAGFGFLRSFNLVVDPQNRKLNKGFAFFEYSNEKDMEKAIKALDGFEIMDKKLKVQKAAVGAKAPANNKLQPQQLGFQVYLKGNERVKIPLFALTPSRVVQYLNMVGAEDLVDDQEKKEIFRDLCDECKEYGDVVDIKAPSPDPNTGHCTAGVGKIFVKFNHIVAAKQARFHISGRRYRGKLIIGSFYPENYFDTNEFDISAE